MGWEIPFEPETDNAGAGKSEILSFHGARTYSMNVTVNSKPYETSAAHLHDLLVEHSLLDKKGTAVALNGEVIPKSNWSEHTLQENDQILIITATQGG